ncbi:hypothetical protein LV164_002204 [Aspergillus fumigatus]|nr:hypothetical protein KXX57_008058 [Aspergillus fumigatus]KAH2309535.1 hypothetical protein KXV47_005795 [Aspergillus fumigatus]KAH2653960.1 hypothetical protein KXV32_003210 [Aspergillus fumigatus]KAH2920265.1 hypothetical protein KXW25_004008 [Aspergillus fumigatus]KAH3005438.1 hypothetical protein KXW60_004875 [Aspergillus fumigatus]
MHSPCTYYDRAPSFAGRGRRFFRQNYYVCGPNPRAGGIGGLVKVALVATATYFVCKKIYHCKLLLKWTDCPEDYTEFASPFKEVSIAEWIERALQAGIDSLITGYLEAKVIKGETIRFPSMGDTGRLEDLALCPEHD